MTNFRFVVNTFLGNPVINGTWNLQIQQQSSTQATEHIKTIQNWDTYSKGTLIVLNACSMYKQVVLKKNQTHIVCMIETQKTILEQPFLCWN